LRLLLPGLPKNFPAAVIVVQHLHAGQDGSLAQHYARGCALPVHEVLDKEPIWPGRVYLAPANYHLLVEPDKTFSLSSDEKVNHSRPCIDVTLESASEVYGPRAVGLILTGANSDGALGLAALRAEGGLAVVQDPATAMYPAMPEAALRRAGADLVLSLEDMAAWLGKLALEGTV
jgi:two-component system chemotaxis response regulator CheB